MKIKLDAAGQFSFGPPALDDAIDPEVGGIGGRFEVVGIDGIPQGGFRDVVEQLIAADSLPTKELGLHTIKP